MSPRNSIGAGVENIARGLAAQIVDLSGYGSRTEFEDFAPLATELLARTPAVLQTAALAYAHGVEFLDLIVEDDEGNDVTDERPFKRAALDAFEAIATTFARRQHADIPPDVKRALDSGNF